MSRMKKAILVSTLALTIVATCTVGSMAVGFRGGDSFEIAAEEYADSIESLVEETGKAYEDVTEAYPDNAQNNPNAPAEYIQTVVQLGNNYLSKLSGLTRSFLGR